MGEGEQLATRPPFWPGDAFLDEVARSEVGEGLAEGGGEACEDAGCDHGLLLEDQLGTPFNGSYANLALGSGGHNNVFIDIDVSAYE